MEKSAQFGLWLRTIRPKTLPAAVAPTALGTALALRTGPVNYGLALTALAAALAIQIGTNLINDYYDAQKGADGAERLGPRRGLELGLLSAAAIKRGALLAYFGALLCGIPLVLSGGWPILVIGLLSLAAGFFYTGGPFPLAYIGIADFFVLLFFGFAAVCGSYYLQTGTCAPDIVIAALAPGALSTAILTVNNLRDITSDRAVGKRTLAVRFGPVFAKAEYTLCLLLAWSVPLILVLFFGRGPFLFLCWATVPPAVPLLNIVFKQTGAPLNRALAQTGGLLLLYTLLFIIGYLL